MKKAKPLLFNKEDIMKDNRSSEQREFDSCTFQPLINDCPISHPRSPDSPRKGVEISESVLNRKNYISEYYNDQHKEGEKEITQKDEASVVNNEACSFGTEEKNKIAIPETDTVVRALYLYYREILHLDNTLTEEEQPRVSEEHNCTSFSSKIKDSVINKIDVNQTENAVSDLVRQKNIRTVPANYEKSLIHLKRGKDKREADLLIKKSKELRNYDVVDDISDRLRHCSLDARRNKQKIRLSETVHDNQTCHGLPCIEKEILVTSNNDIPNEELSVPLSNQSLKMNEEINSMTPVKYQNEKNDFEINDCNKKNSYNAQSPLDSTPCNGSGSSPNTPCNGNGSSLKTPCNGNGSSPNTPYNGSSPNSLLEIESPFDSSIDDSRLVDHNIITQTFNIDESPWLDSRLVNYNIITRTFKIDESPILDQDEPLNIMNVIDEPNSINTYTTPNSSKSSPVCMASLKNKLCMEGNQAEVKFTKKNINDSVNIHKDKKRYTNKNFVRNNTSSVSERHKKMIEKYQTSLGTDVKSLEKYLDPNKYHSLHHTTLNKQ